MSAPTDLDLSKRLESQGITLQNYNFFNDPYPGVVYQIPDVHPADQFTFIFRLVQPVSDPSRNAGEMDNVIFILPKNPNKEVRTQAKNISFHLTGGGYVIMNWGNGLIDLIFSGSTGRLIPEDSWDESTLIAKGLMSGYPGKAADFLLGKKADGLPLTVRDTPAWKIFSKFNCFYQYFNGGNEFAYDPQLFSASRMANPRNSQVVLAFFDRIFVGALTEFGYDVDAADPWKINYSFKFTSLPILESVGYRTPVAGVSDRVPSPNELPKDSWTSLVWNKQGSILPSLR